jgi:hypothetical protein
VTEPTLISHHDDTAPVAGAALPSHVKAMKQSDLLRENAENCLQLAERAEGKPAFRRYSRMAQAWTALANEQDWLDGEISPLAALATTAASK